MNTIKGEAATTDAMRVIRRLCKHWSHKYEVQVGETGGEIQLPAVRVILRAEPERLCVSLENPLEEIPLRLTGVVGEHLQRMSGDAAFTVKWEGADIAKSGT
jgi:uncharacterized protein